MASSPFPSPRRSESAEWVSVSDLMSGLMLVFLCIAVLYLRKQEQVAREYEQVQTDLSSAMKAEFSAEELRRWGAELDQSGLVIRFVDQENQFEGGKAALSVGFQAILADFFPQFIAVLGRPDLRPHVVEVRIEGHTSSEFYQGGAPLPRREAYLANMALSQDRALSVLAYVINLNGVHGAWEDWLGRVLRANGLSSSVPVLSTGPSGVPAEDVVRSRRVEFRVVTDGEDRMREIVGAIGGRAAP
jgi:outer membrane protein OmpA-like peptidoglycan-associated protein